MQPEAVEVIVWIADDESTRSYDASIMSIHTELDLALLHTSKHLPITKSHQMMGASPSIGDTTLMVGYGRRPGTDPGVRSLISAAVTKVRPSHFIVRPRSLSGACLGDSGAPVWGWSKAGDPGDPELLGILVAGAESCQGPDKVVMLAPVQGWLRRFMAQQILTK